MLRRFGILAALLLSVGAKAQTRENNSIFEMAAQHEYFVIIGTGDQIKPNDEAAGGPGGHTLMYVKGLNFDYTSGLRSAVIEKSLAKTPVGFEHTGVGLSIDSGNENTSFLVFADNANGRDFFRGLPVEGVLDESEVSAQIDQVERLGTYKGVRVKKNLVDRNLPADQYTREVIRISRATDFAIQYGRDVYLVGFATDREGAMRIAEFANEYNKPYATDQKIYEWSGPHQNCATFVAGALNAACVRNAIGERLPMWKQLFNIALPRNGISTVQVLVHHGGRNIVQQWLNPSKSGIEFETIRGNEQWWKLLKQGRRLPVGLGAISAKFDTYRGDSLFGDDLWIARMPHKIPGANRLSDRAFKTPEYTEIEAHLNYWGAAIEVAYAQSLKMTLTPDVRLYQRWLLSMAQEHQRLRLAFEVQKSCPAILTDQQAMNRSEKDRQKLGRPADQTAHHGSSSDPSTIQTRTNPWRSRGPGRP